MVITYLELYLMLSAELSINRKGDYTVHLCKLNYIPRFHSLYTACLFVCLFPSIKINALVWNLLKSHYYQKLFYDNVRCDECDHCPAGVGNRVVIVMRGGKFVL